MFREKYSPTREKFEIYSTKEIMLTTKKIKFYKIFCIIQSCFLLSTIILIYAFGSIIKNIVK
jgi:hypothetical protein